MTASTPPLFLAKPQLQPLLDELRSQRNTAQDNHKIALAQVPNFDGTAYAAICSLKPALEARNKAAAAKTDRRGKQNGS